VTLNDDRNHAAHLRIALDCLAQHPYEIAVVRAGLRFKEIAIRANKPQRFNCTLTAFWMRLVQMAREESMVASVDDLLAKYPCLNDRDLPFIYYSKDRLFSNEGRMSVIEPDIRDLPNTLAAISRSKCIPSQ
jgi:hypothetical protein